MARHNLLGKVGEELAEKYLRDEGYTILERDWKLGSRDIDIIATSPEGTDLVFVEVKTRTDDAIALPTDAVDLKKMRSIGIAANAYVKERDTQEELRFDIVTIVGTSREQARIEHFKDAFNPLLLY